ARQRLGRARPYRDFRRIPARRQPESDVEPLGVDRLEFPRPTIGAVRAVGARKSGHAGESHGERRSLAPPMDWHRRLSPATAERRPVRDDARPMAGRFDTAANFAGTLTAGARGHMIK